MVVNVAISNSSQPIKAVRGSTRGCVTLVLELSTSNRICLEVNDRRERKRREKEMQFSHMERERDEEAVIVVFLSFLVVCLDRKQLNTKLSSSGSVGAPLNVTALTIDDTISIIDFKIRKSSKHKLAGAMLSLKGRSLDSCLVHKSKAAGLGSELNSEMVE